MRGQLIRPITVDVSRSVPRMRNHDRRSTIENPEQQRMPPRLGQGLAAARPLKTPAAGTLHLSTAFQQTPSPPQEPSQHTTSSDFLRCREEVNIATPVLPASAQQDQQFGKKKSVKNE